MAMKKIFTIGIISLLALSSFQACTKEELVTINNPLELDENSIQYQQYMEERAIQLIKEYRFDRLGNTIDRIKDPVARERVLALLAEYRNRAFNEALYYAKPNKDTIFFFPPNIDSRLEAKRLYISNLYQKAVVNEIGVLHGFKNFPNVETVDIGNSLATGIKDLNGLPELKTFNWTFEPYYFREFYPDVELAPRPLDFDFSQNHKLETVNISYVDLTNLKFPATKIKSVNLGEAIVNSGDVLNTIAANKVSIRGDSETRDLVLKTQYIDSLSFFVSGLTSLDVSESNLLNLYTIDIENITLNEGLQKLRLGADRLSAKPILPNSLEELDLVSYTLPDKDFSTATNVKRMLWAGLGYNDLALPIGIEELTISSQHPYPTLIKDFRSHDNLKKIIIHEADFDFGSVQFPQSLESLALMSFGSSIHIKSNGDYSDLHNLKTFAVKLAKFDKMPLLPSSLLKLEMLFADFTDSDVVDLSHLTNLNSIFMQAGRPITLILPNNLTEAAVIAGAKSLQSTAAFYLPTGSTIVNAPSWLDQYVGYL